MEIAIEYGYEEEGTKKTQEMLGWRCSWGLGSRLFDGEGEWRPCRSRVRAVVCDWAA